MAWQTPKTDHSRTGRFNKDDYNRIIGNIAVLKELAAQLYQGFALQDMGEEKKYGDPIYADEINAIESNLAEICGNTYPFEIGKQKTYYAQQPATDAKEFNRIESACLLIYNNLNGQITGKRRLAFTLGGDRL